MTLRSEFIEFVADIRADMSRWCEYIAFRGLWRVGYARIHEANITDTELQVGRFLLPTPGTRAVYHDDTEMYWHIGESDVSCDPNKADEIPEAWRLPAMFKGEGVRGHKYIVWDGPVYYLPPSHSGLQQYGQ